ncbi:FtsH protease activity modulator HflK [Neotabrizicola sp. sgz301269]|uniref:FtsH protease activity modulator HflK n=1 Tax=Neotabrizicola sp. sgz301269 TaxID=3276282 RepID=UPI00376F46EA
MAGSGGPWGGGGSGGGGGDDDRGGPRGQGDDDRRPGGRRPGEGGSPMPEIDEIMRKGQEQLRVLMGGRGRNGNGGGPRGPQRGGPNPLFTPQGIALGVLALVAAWAFMSFYTVRTEERSVELFLGEAAGVGQPGLNFAPWPLVTYEKVQVTGERTTEIGMSATVDGGLMLTRDQNIVDIGFQVVWNISDPEKYLFNLADPEVTISAVSESAMRDIIARSELSPILNRDRGVIASDLRKAVQTTLDSYNAGINVIRVNLQRAQPPREVIDSFREVQAAQQERDRLEKEADAYANKATAGARGEAAQLLEQAEAYRANAVNSAQGEAARFLSVYEEYVKAPEVTRRRLYLETMEKVLGGMNLMILDGVQGGAEGGQGVVPFLPLNELARPAPGVAPAAGAAAGTGGTN